MDFLTDWLTNWLKELLIGGIMGNLEGLFDTVNTTSIWTKSNMIPMCCFLFCVRTMRDNGQ